MDSLPPLRPFDEHYVAMAARMLGLLSHPTRLHLVLLLAQGESYVSRLCEVLDLPQSNVSHHLALLRNTGLVSDRRDGQFVLYRIHVEAWSLVANGFFDRLLGGEDEVTLQNFHLGRVRKAPP